MTVRPPPPISRKITRYSFLRAYNVALAANFISGVISVVLGAFGPQMLRIIPPAALLVPVAGIGFAFLGLEQASAPFGAPLVGFLVRFSLQPLL